jgi:hypothetical protein
MSIPTTERLARSLEAHNDPRMKKMIARAREGYYDDYKSPIAAPTMQLVQDLLDLGQGELADRAAKGEWDGTAEEAEAWANSEEGKKAIADAGGEDVIEQQMRETFTPELLAKAEAVAAERMRQMKELARVTGDRKYKRGKGRRNWN